jgi:hypothetical protein
MTQEHKEFLNDLRDSGTTNMFGAARYLVEEFPELSKQEARAILSEWMASF